MKSSPKSKNRHGQMVKYKMYGILDTADNRVIYVSLNQEEVTTEYDLGLYEESRYGVVSFNIILG